MNGFQLRGLARAALAVCAIAGFTAAQAAATITIQNRDPAGVGFNDPTPVAPVGGNPGTTLGAQRLYVYQYVANIWSQAIDSSVPITVSAGWEALACTSTGATLGSASAWNGWRDFPGAPKPNTWYPQALANKLSGLSLADYYGQEDDGTGYGNVDIKTQFNVNLGKPGCLDGSPFYLGVDGNPPAGQVNFVATLLHEIGHGLGFALFTTNGGTGAQLQNLPSIWEHFMVDNTSGKRWTQMTNAERAASGINFRQLAWDGPNSVLGVPQVLSMGVTPVPALRVSGPNAGSIAGTKQFATANFGPQLGVTPVVADVMPVVSQTTANGLTGPGCGPLTALDALAVRGRIALIDRGVCGFAVKVKNAQNAGAIGVLIGNTQTGTFGNMGGEDPTITIPSLMVTFADSNALKTATANRSRTASGVTVSMSAAPTGGLYAGTDAFNRPLLYTPNPRVAGSSISHWDTFASPNLLMEPNISPDLGTLLSPPKDLTVPLLKDLGW